MRSNTEASRRLVLEKLFEHPVSDVSISNMQVQLTKRIKFQEQRRKCIFCLGVLYLCLVSFSLYTLVCEQETESRKDQTRKTENLENHTHNSAEYTDQYTEKCDA